MVWGLNDVITITSFFTAIKTKQKKFKEQFLPQSGNRSCFLKINSIKMQSFFRPENIYFRMVLSILSSQSACLTVCPSLIVSLFLSVVSISFFFSPWVCLCFHSLLMSKYLCVNFLFELTLQTGSLRWGFKMDNFWTAGVDFT